MGKPQISDLGQRIIGLLAENDGRVEATPHKLRESDITYRLIVGGDQFWNLAVIDPIVVQELIDTGLLIKVGTRENLYVAGLVTTIYRLTDDTDLVRTPVGS